jgi:hypothetical protein
MHEKVTDLGATGINQHKPEAIQIIYSPEAY